MIGIQASIAPWSFPARLVQALWSGTGATIDGVVFPAECPICDASTEGSPFCRDCRAEMIEAAGRACDRCAMPVGPFADRSKGCDLCRGKPLGFDRAVALGPYQGPIRQVCLMLKQERNGWLAPVVATLVAESAFGKAPVDPATWVVPVPLHWRKRLARGYNQAEALAEGIGRALSIPVHSPIRRVVATPALARLGRLERREVLKGAFRVGRSAGLAGRSILLVDDILTTGATTGAAARTLKKAGAASVTVVVVARAEGRP